MKRFLASVVFLSSLMMPGAIGAGQQPPTNASAASNGDDRIYDQVRMKLTADPDVKGGALDVVVKDGVVTLTGRVGSDKGRSKATKLAKKVKGVKAVDNQLSVGPPI